MAAQPKETKVWATWHPNCGWFDAHLTKSDAERSFHAPYDNWKMAKRDGWKIIRCAMKPMNAQG